MASKTMMLIDVPTHRELAIVKAQMGFTSFSRTIDWLIEELEKKEDRLTRTTSDNIEPPTATKRILHDIKYNRK